MPFADRCHGGGFFIPKVVKHGGIDDAGGDGINPSRRQLFCKRADKALDGAAGTRNGDHAQDYSVLLVSLKRGVIDAFSERKGTPVRTTWV